MLAEQKTDLGKRLPAPAPTGPKSGASLTRKGLLTLVVMAVYFVLGSLVVAYERNYLLDSVHLLNEIHQREERVVALNIQVSRAILMVNENYFAPDVDVSAKILALEVEAVLKGLSRMGQHYPNIAEDAVLMDKSLSQLIEQPTRAVIADIRGIFNRVVIDLNAITGDIRNRKQWLLEDYEHIHDRLAMEWIAFAAAGLGCLSGLMIFFFRRLATDVQLAQQRATEIVRGYRGDPLPVTRHDELGDLIVAVNNMQDELRKRETQLELSRQQQFHKEKMAAIGSLATSVAHEINNPLAAIVGIAQAMADELEGRDGNRASASCHPEMILEQARRVMQITRQIGEFSVPQSQEPELTDINGLVRSTCKFVAFDHRFRQLELVTRLDPALPAVHVVADRIVQVLMNLLINAADALESCTDTPPRISVATELRDGSVRIAVSDNGCGIVPANLDKVFMEHFTTKPPGRGYGLGLALCRSLISDAGGDITIESRVGEGTTVAIRLPLPLRGGERNKETGGIPQCMS